MNSLLLKTSAHRLSSVSLRAATASRQEPQLPLSFVQPQQPQQRHKHTVRVILQDDLPNGKAYSGDVLHVAAGYARNFLIPQRKALYATRQNFARLGMKDPEMETPEERQARLARERLEGEDEDLKAADLLKNYLRNKVVRLFLFGKIGARYQGLWILRLIFVSLSLLTHKMPLSLYFSNKFTAQNLSQCGPRDGANAPGHGRCQGNS